jgi:hypothetical protein
MQRVIYSLELELDPGPRQQKMMLRARRTISYRNYNYAFGRIL